MPGDTSIGFGLSDTARAFDATHGWHLHIHEYDGTIDLTRLVALSSRSRFQKLQRFHTVANDMDFVPQSLQLHAENLLIHDIVF